MNKCTQKLLFTFLLLCSTQAYASHIVGGEVYYKYIGAVGTGTKYEITLIIYEDCINGDPDAIAADNPAFLAVYDPANTTTPVVFDSVRYSSFLNIPINFSDPCMPNIPEVCLLKKAFTKSFILPSNATGYYVSYQKCCRNGQVLNVHNSGNSGATYFCVIPPSSAVVNKSSAVFNNYPPLVMCINTPLIYDNSATDADGDSLSYEFCDATSGPDASSNNEVPGPPPYDNVGYNFPFTGAAPMPGSPTIQINAQTGLITGTPNLLGRFLVTVCCNEWRNGVKINTIKREFQFVVTDCSKLSFFKPSAGYDTVILKGESIQFNAIGGSQYLWEPAANLNDPTIANPYGTYPDTGRFTYLVKATNASGCTAFDTITVTVVDNPYVFAPTAFTPNGDGLNDVFRPRAAGYKSLNFFRIYNRSGNLVYHSESLNQGWDGTVNHKQADMATYFWQISFVDRSGNQSYLKGDVTLVR